jgi:hypothetical protein
VAETRVENRRSFAFQRETLMARTSYGQKIETITVALVIPIQHSLADHRQLYSEGDQGRQLRCRVQNL